MASSLADEEEGTEGKEEGKKEGKKEGKEEGKEEEAKEGKECDGENPERVDVLATGRSWRRQTQRPNPTHNSKQREQRHS